MKISVRNRFVMWWVFLACLLFPVSHAPGSQTATDHTAEFSSLFNTFSRAADRTSGSEDTQKIASFIKDSFKSLGYTAVGSQYFPNAVRMKNNSRVVNLTTGKSRGIDPFLSNAISPHTVSGDGLTGHIIYVKSGELKDFNGKPVKDAIVLMDIDSKGNWLNALSLGARAIIYLYNEEPDKYLFEDKEELSPVNFPRFIMSEENAADLFGDFENPSDTDARLRITLTSDMKWKKITAENVYCLVEGTDKTLRKEVIIVESFYDAAGYVPGKTPGADQACSIASLLDLARHLKQNPSKRSILLVATAGHGNGLAGMREFIWGLNTKTRILRRAMKEHDTNLDQLQLSLDALNRFINQESMDETQTLLLKENLHEVIKTKIDTLSNELMQLRLKSDPDDDQIRRLADRRMVLKRLEGKSDLETLTDEEKQLAGQLIPHAVERLNTTIRDVLLEKKFLTSTMDLKKTLKRRKPMVAVSLHLSSHGNGVGAFNEGWLYDIKPTVNVFAPYVKLNTTLLDAGEKAGDALDLPGFFKDTLRPSMQRAWQSYFKDTPALGGEVSRLAGMLGVSLVTTEDARRYWGTPFDTADKVDLNRAAKQSRFVSRLISDLAAAPYPVLKRLPRNGFSTVTGRANFLRHGAVFADAPAPGSVILSFQGPAIFHNIVNESGIFTIKGAVHRKLTLHKVILEGYKFDSDTGQTIWAVDKKKTTLARYRVKMINPNMETDLIMFACSQTTILNLLEPRTFAFMTRLHLFDARVDATPIRFWYSRIDTRSSLIASIYLSPGTRMKLTLSDSLLTKKLILTHSQGKGETGNGYAIDETPVIAPTQYLAALDMWALLNPRIENLEQKGINNQRIRDLQAQGNQALKDAQQYLADMSYDKFFSAAGNALGLAGRVYDHVESTQKDVLYGVLFYIMLFAPFAFCMERLIFAFINIYKRIAGFIGILLLLITIIYNVHPAFDLAYSPVVVILAFFIIGLSGIVTWIIFHHFENEMKRFQMQGKKGNEGEISLFKAFSASFFMGINNLRRRRVRTMLTCTTLVILTFTIMSFTSVKSMRQHSRLLYNDQTPYQGLLIKQINWKTLPDQAFSVIRNTMADEMIATPRGWLENENRTQAITVPVSYQSRRYLANAMLGLSHTEPEISDLSRLITQGRWFNEQDRYSILIPERMARHLKLGNPEKSEIFINLWSTPFKVIGTFSGEEFDRFKDLDGEPITPAIFPDEVFQQATDAEMDAMESGDDVRAFQSRYQHLPFDQTVIIPFETLMSLGGNLKSVALKYKTPPNDNSTAFKLVDRFGLWLFSGEKEGVFLYSASDKLNYSGLPNVLIPMLISIFIVLNTMIGSVQERKKEIGIYTSIGMAPSHVSIIFIAEALAYAVISVVLGYILAQVTVQVFAGTALLNGLTVNYSSLGGVFAMALVMMVVLVSAVYPSKVAASIAIPDVEKSWEMAKAEGDLLNIDLPFLIKDSEAFSVGGFLYELFETHRSVSHGIFSVGRLHADPTTQRTKADSDSGTPFTIGFTAWLAPFDLGVMQQVEFTVKPSAVFDDYMEIKMSITRNSGEQNTWWRINKRFVNLIRKQLLIWRSMEDGHKDRYDSFMTSILNIKGQIL